MRSFGSSKDTNGGKQAHARHASSYNGGVAWPLSKPQQRRAPFERTPQAYSTPQLTEVRAPGGGVDSPRSLRPQQATSPLARTPHVWNQPALTERKAPGGGEDSPK